MPRVPRLRRSGIVCSAFVFIAILLPLHAWGAAFEAEVLGESDEGITLRFKLQDWERVPVMIQGFDYEAIRIPGEAVQQEARAPDLPHAARSIIVPADAALGVRVVSTRWHDEPARVAPSKGTLSRRIDPDTLPFEFGRAYERDAFWPSAPARLGEPYVMRDHRGVAVSITPFQYNPARELLRVYDEIVVEVLTGKGAARNVLDVPPRQLVRPFREIYRTHFLNYGSHAPTRGTDYDPLDEEGDLLIIAHDPWVSLLSGFESHKESAGIPTTVVGVGTIGNDSASIKAYIQDRYDTSDLAFVLLVGDAAQVATNARQVGGESGASDSIYGKLAGADDYPEVIVGRFSAQTEAELQTQIDRTIDYENLPATGQDWFKRGTGIASAEGGGGQGDEGQSDITHQDEIRGWLLGDGYTEVDQIYDPGAQDDDVSAALNAGRGIVNYTGHGSSSSWGTSGFNNADINALVNDDMLPFIVSVACNNGEFHHYDSCFGETWLRATNADAATGAIAVYASSVSQYWSPPMEGQDEFNLLLSSTDKPYSSFGALAFAGSCSMMDAYGGDGVDMFDTWIIFGDPTLRVIGAIGPPHGLRVTPGEGFESSGPAGGPFPGGSQVYTLENAGDDAIEFSAFADQPWLVVSPGSGLLEGGATADVSVDVVEAARNLDVGSYLASVSFVNVTDHDGDTTRPVRLEVGGETVVHGFDCDSDPGWSVEGEWEFGIPTGEGGGYTSHPDPTSGATGSQVLGANLRGNVYPAQGGPFYLTAGPIDLGAVSDAKFSFQRWLNMAGQPYASATVEVSPDGSSWSERWAMSQDVLDGSWQMVEIDLGPEFDRASQAYVRWSYGVNRSLPLVGSGWNIDDIEFKGRPATARVTLLVERDLLTWGELPGALAFDVQRGELGTLLESDGDFGTSTLACEAEDLEGHELAITGAPDPGGAWWYLVRGVGSSGPMTWQALADSQQGVRDEEMSSSGASCQ